VITVPVVLPPPARPSQHSSPLSLAEARRLILPSVCCGGGGHGVEVKLGDTAPVVLPPLVLLPSQHSSPLSLAEARCIILPSVCCGGGGGGGHGVEVKLDDHCTCSSGSTMSTQFTTVERLPRHLK